MHRDVRQDKVYAIDKLNSMLLLPGCTCKSESQSQEHDETLSKRKIWIIKKAVSNANALSTVVVRSSSLFVEFSLHKHTIQTNVVY